MTSKPVAFLLADLGVTKTHSRPYTSSDNPYSEAHFRTLKYRPEFPARFESIEHARLFCRAFFHWYNYQHRHSGIGLMTPATVQDGLAQQTRDRRAEVLLAAYRARPERFVNHPPSPPAIPTAVWIASQQACHPRECSLITRDHRLIRVDRHRGCGPLLGRDIAERCHLTRVFTTHLLTSSMLPVGTGLHGSSYMNARSFSAALEQNLAPAGESRRAGRPTLRRSGSNVTWRQYTFLEGRRYEART